ACTRCLGRRRRLLPREPPPGDAIPVVAERRLDPGSASSRPLRAGDSTGAARARRPAAREARPQRTHRLPAAARVPPCDTDRRRDGLPKPQLLGESRSPGRGVKGREKSPKMTLCIAFLRLSPLLLGAACRRAVTASP